MPHADDWSVKLGFQLWIKLETYLKVRRDLGQPVNPARGTADVGGEACRQRDHRKRESDKLEAGTV